MDIRKALITAAGKNQRTLPLQSLVDRDGVTKTALAIIIEEILRAGIEQIGVVISPGDEAAYRAAAGAHAGAAHVHRASRSRSATPTPFTAPRSFAAATPFLLLVGDTFISAPRRRAARSSSWKSRARKTAPSPRCKRRTKASCPTTAPSAAGS